MISSPPVLYVQFFHHLSVSSAPFTIPFKRLDEGTWLHHWLEKEACRLAYRIFDGAAHRYHASLYHNTNDSCPGGVYVTLVLGSEEMP